MSILHALNCPYCGDALLKESYYFRCGRDHRFAASLEGGPADPPEGGPADSLDPGPQPSREEATRRLVLRVLAHPDRKQIGKLHTFRAGEP